MWSMHPGFEIIGEDEITAARTQGIHRCAWDPARIGGHVNRIALNNPSWLIPAGVDSHSPHCVVERGCQHSSSRGSVPIAPENSFLRDSTKQPASVTEKYLLWLQQSIDPPSGALLCPGSFIEGRDNSSIHTLSSSQGYSDDRAKTVTLVIF